MVYLCGAVSLCCGDGFVGVLFGYNMFNYTGCLIVIAHDRHFLDKVVDHLFVFEGAGQIRDVWSSYSEYRASLDQDGSTVSSAAPDELEEEKPELIKSAKLSYMDQREFDRLGDEIQQLEERKDAINLQFQDASLPLDDITRLGGEMKQLLVRLQDKEERWLELLGKVG